MNYQSADKRKIIDSEESGPFPHRSVESVDNLRVGSNSGGSGGSGGSGKDTVQNKSFLVARKYHLRSIFPVIPPTSTIRW